MTKKAIIIGASPAGFIAAYTLLQQTDIVPIILEVSGNISSTPGASGQQQSYINYDSKLFTNPVQLSFGLLHKVGLSASLRIVSSYLISQLFPFKKEKTLEDVLINRYGKTIYKSFYKNYIEKQCGAPCREIPAAWGIPTMDNVTPDSTLVNQVTSMGGQILPYHSIKEIVMQEGRITSIIAINNITEEVISIQGDYFIATIPMQNLITSMNGQIPDKVKELAARLRYRNTITISILLQKLSSLNKGTGEWKPLNLLESNIYIAQEEIKVGRIHLFNPLNNSIWVNMEYYCASTDVLWGLTNENLQQIAISELEKTCLACSTNVLETRVTRTEKAFAIYSNTNDQFSIIRNYMDKFKNLFLVGGNAMHQNDAAIQTSISVSTIVNNISNSVTGKENLCGVVTPLLEIPYESKSLKDYIFKDQANKWYLWTSIIAIITQFAIFKYFYPFAGFINGDSYAYLETAYRNLDINTYPIGYSKFLRLFSVFTKYDTALIAFQYLLLQVSLLSFIYTLFKFFEPEKWIKVSLFVLMLFNPILLYLSNYVSSDALFLSLSLIWLTQLLWMLHKPTKELIIWHGVILFLAFTVRYNALWYPLISALAFLLSKQSLWAKIIGFAFGVVLIGAFMGFTTYKYYKLTGLAQFTPFTGWQMANNAMYAYRYVDSSARKPVPVKFRELDNMIRTYFDTTRDVKKYPFEMLKASTIYMWSPGLPLQLYMQNQFKNDTTASILKRWASVSPLYKAYGTYLIKQYPSVFGEQYLWPNFLKYYVPPVEFLESYNMGVDSVQPIAKEWFGYKNNKVRTRIKGFRVTILNVYPIMAGIINVTFLFSLVCIIMLQTYKQYPSLRGLLPLVFCLWGINMAFSVFASPIALRFQLFPILVSTAFTFLFIGHIWKASNSK